MYEVTCKTSLSIRGWVKNELRKLWEMFWGPQRCTNVNIEVWSFTLPLSQRDIETLRARGICEEEITRLMGLPKHCTLEQ